MREATSRRLFIISQLSPQVSAACDDDVRFLLQASRGRALLYLQVRGLLAATLPDWRRRALLYLQVRGLLSYVAGD